LSVNGHIDPKLWLEHRTHCRVRRFWDGEEEQVGRLVHKPGGSEHARWVFDYDPEASDDDESGYRFGAHVFAPGEYVSIRSEDGDLHTFQVASVESVG
jgi:Fe-S cluster assembly iron-binding protein IscA